MTSVQAHGTLGVPKTGHPPSPPTWSSKTAEERHDLCCRSLLSTRPGTLVVHTDERGSFSDTVLL